MPIKMSPPPGARVTMIVAGVHEGFASRTGPASTTMLLRAVGPMTVRSQQPGSGSPMPNTPENLDPQERRWSWSRDVAAPRQGTWKVSVPVALERDSCIVSLYDPLPGAGTAKHMPWSRRVPLPGSERPIAGLLTAVVPSGTVT